MTLDLNAYLSRVGLTGSVKPDREGLEALHLAHATHIPFENLDVLLGLPIRLDVSSLQAKLVAGRRGGYCFEHNLLFAAVLMELGFPVTPLAARVRYGTTQVLPRTHMTLLVEADESRWLADVGFGGEGLLLPVRMELGEETRQFGRTYGVIREAGHEHFVLRSRRDTGWIDLYAFTLEPQRHVDYEMANHYTSTHPNSRFRQTLTVQLPTPEARSILRDWELTVETAGTLTRRTLATHEELLDVLAATFGLHFPRGTRFQFGPVGGGQ
jgi:N-hydroxyarylamine O-acetyltransferase